MADTSKAERLAAARKKLQDYQRTKVKPTSSSGKSSPSIAGLQSVQNTSFTSDPSRQIPNSAAEAYFQHSASAPSSSPPLSQTSISNHGSHHSSRETLSAPELPNPFNGIQQAQIDLTKNSWPKTDEQAPCVPHTNNIFNASSYFDSVRDSSPKVLTNVPANEDHNSWAHHSSQKEAPVQTTSHLFSQSCDERIDQWNIGLEAVPFIRPISPGAVMPQLPIVAPDIVTKYDVEESISQTPFEFPSYLNNLETNQANSGQESDNLIHNEQSSQSTLCENESSVAINKTDNAVNGCSSTESLRQISDQITQLFDEPLNERESQHSSVVSPLELRNQELAAQLAAERRSNQQLQFNLKESQSQISHLEAKVLDLQSQQEIVLARHLGPLQEQLRAHAQTVGILVGEKTELEAALTHHTTATKQHASEVEELQNRLRASRHRVSELEKELSGAIATAGAADQVVHSHSQEVDRLRLENSLLFKQLEDAEQDASEARQKLNARISEVNALDQQLKEKQSQLSLAQLRVTQLSSSDNPEASMEVEALHQHKISLERRCAELTETIRQLSTERDQADVQYQQYVAQLNGQIQSLSSKMEAANDENERYKSREEELVRNMSELEKQLQQQIQLHQQHQQQRESLQQSSEAPNKSSDDHTGLSDVVAELEAEKEILKNSISMQYQELCALKTDLEEKEVRIQELEALCSDRPDQTVLLATMESDKVAAAQATSQNTILKQQLQELQDGFIKMSNDKLHLTEGLEHEKHVNKEMGEKIAQLAEELHELRLSVAEKERRLQEYRGSEGGAHSYKHENGQNHSHEHNHNHDRDEEHSHGNSNEHNHEHSDSCSHTHEMTDAHRVHVNGDAVALQEQLSQAKDHIQNLTSQNNNFRRLLAQKSTESNESGCSSSATEGATTDDAAADLDTNCEDTQNNNANYLSMQLAMEKLQERFTRTISEVAELTEEKQRLEHLVLQLQEETETIGEYVTLYQIQRAVLQQRARDKDHQLQCIAAEREELRKKLNNLSGLVHSLVEEKCGAEAAKEALLSSDGAPVDEDKACDMNDPPEIKPASFEVEETSNSGQASTAGKILSLLNEIGNSALVEGSSATPAETFHPCPWCSGRLITV